jgi:hypothetical protein
MKNILAILSFLLVLPIAVNSQTKTTTYDEIAPFSEGLAAVRQGDLWAFIDEEANQVIDFRDDLVWNKNADITIQGILGIRYPQFKNGRCLIKELKEDNIPYYGFIDKTGVMVIKPEYLNITHFDQELAIGIYVREILRGRNEIKLNVIDYIFTEVVLNTNGEIIWPITEREHILTSKRRYKIPELRAKLISNSLLAIQTKERTWEIKKLNLNL